MYNFFKDCLQFFIFTIGMVEIAKLQNQQAFTGEFGFYIFVISIVLLLIKWDKGSKKMKVILIKIFQIYFYRVLFLLLHLLVEFRNFIKIKLKIMSYYFF